MYIHCSHYGTGPGDVEIIFVVVQYIFPEHSYLLHQPSCVRNNIGPRALDGGGCDGLSDGLTS